jgi:hypothetical protein
MGKKQYVKINGKAVPIQQYAPPTKKKPPAPPPALVFLLVIVVVAAVVVLCAMSASYGLVWVAGF